uniref:MIF4G domain-containing protein n=2 Tax=Tetraodon nigroviridis TaxID=99883 RepID=H3DN96_TETNG
MDLSELVTTQAGEQGEPQQRRIISGLSLNANKILHKAENAWKPLSGKLASGCGVTEEERKTQEVLRELQAILNKLTPGNFGSLMKSLAQLEINTEARLKAVIGLIFDKAVSEHSFCPAYAKMCHH